jgi:NAD(P)-dependent dehydrogenase (short-subunit alcohol dehydrogenase family)
MDLFLKDKIILVTGGAKGIGAAIVRACAEENALPVIVDKDGPSAEKLQNSLRQSGFESAMYETELTNPDASKSAVEFTLQKFGRIDALVNNAGVNDGIGLANGTPEKFLTSLERNLHHYYYMAHFALPALKQSKDAIVNISSKTALTGQGNTATSRPAAILADPRVGRRTARCRRPRQRRHSRGSPDAALRGLAGQISVTARSSLQNRSKDSSRQAYDYRRRDRLYRFVFAF